MNKRLLSFLRVLLVAAVAALALGVGCDTPVPTATPSLTPSTLRGTNLAGAEWKWQPGVTPVEGQDYQWVSHQDIDYLTSKGFTFGRLLFSWEIIQPTLNGPLATTYLNTLIDRVNYATSKGMWIMIEPHGGSSEGFARYKGNAIGSSQVPNNAFADLWTKLATQFKGNPRVVFGLMNEPNNISTVQWYAGAQAAITGIRGTGSANMIMVAGNGWSQPGSWNDTWYDTAPTKVSNATGWATLNDPLKRTVVSVHTYFDNVGGGGTSDVASVDVIAKRLQPVVTWARAKGLKVHLSEFGADAATAGSQAAVDNALKYIDANKDVLLGWSWWAYGPPAWWGGFRFTLCPKNNYTTDDPKVAWLKPYLQSPEAPVTDAGVDAATLPTPSPTKPLEPIAFTKGQVFTTNSGTTNWVYVPTSYDSTHETPTQLFVWLHGCGGQSQYDVSMVSPGGTQAWISLAPGGREKACWSSYATDGAKILAAIADLQKHFNIDPNRIVLGGYSSGGDIGYPMLFSNASMFAGALFENTGPSSAALTAAKTATRKMPIVHLAHTGDTTYPIANVRTNMTTLKNLSFPVTLLEQPGTHWDNDTATSGTAYDLRKYLLPNLNAGWTVPPPPQPACVYTYSDWGECTADSMQRRTLTGSSPSPCTAGTQLLTQPCVYVPPACVYTYSAWGVCEPDSTQKRTIIGSVPSPCSPSTQVLTTPCTYVPPDTDGDGIPDPLDKCPTVPGVKTSDGTSNGCKPLVVTSVKTYDWGTGYCKQFYFQNPNPVAMSWKQMTIYLGDGKLRGPDSLWGGTTPDTSKVGTVVVTPVFGGAVIPAGANAQAVGYCADYGPKKYAGRNGGLAY